MYYAGIDLHRNDVVIAIEDQQGIGSKPRRFPSREPAAIVAHLTAHRPFQAVVEASCGYRWLYDLLTPFGSVVLAHPRRLRAIVKSRAIRHHRLIIHAFVSGRVPKIARVAVAQKLAPICWLRLMRWHHAAGNEERELVSYAVMGGSGPILGTGGR